MGDSGLSLNVPHFTKAACHLQVDLLESVLANRQVIENALLKIRADKFEFKGTELMFVWDLSWWKTLEKVFHWLQPLRRCVCI